MRFLKMSAVSKNPFDALPTEDDEDEPVPVKKEVKDVKKPAVAAAKPTASAAPAKEAPKSQAAPQGDRRPPRREFERHSGTGRGRRADGAEDKRGGSGKYNWGTKESGTTPNDEASGDLNESRELTEEEKAAAEAAAEARRKEEAQMTLDEFLKLKEQEKADAEKLEARKVDAIDMKGLKVKDSAAGEDVWTIGDEEKGGKGAKQKKSGRKATPSTDVNFTTPPIETSSPSGGGRGRGRGGGGRGDYRPRGPGGGGGGGAEAAVPNVNLDNTAFPSLG